MNTRIQALSTLLATTAALALAGTATAQIDSKLHGTWVGTGAENRGERVTIDQSAMTLEGERIPIRSGGPGVLILGDPEDEWRLSYRFRGAELLVTEDGFTSTWSKAGGPTPTPEPEPDDIDEVGGSDPFAGTFENGRVRLVLRSQDGEHYTGELSVGSHRFSVTAGLRDGTLEGELAREGRTSTFSAWIGEGNGLQVRNGGKTLALRRSGQAQRPNHGGGDDGAASARGTITFERRTLSDPMLGGIQSHTLCVPTDFQVRGGVLWTPTAIVTNQIDLSVSDRTGTAFTYDKCRHFFYADPQSLQMMGKHMGQELGDGSIVLGPPQKLGDAVPFAILPGLRPNARNIRVVDARVDEAMKQAILRMSGNQRPQSTPESQSWDSFEIVLVTYTENGQEFEEEFSYMVSGIHNSYRGLGGNSDSGTWSIMNTNSIRAPRGQLRQRRNELSVIRSSLRPTPQWWTAQSAVVASIMQARQRRHAITMNELRESGRRIARANNDISDIQMETFRKTMDSQDRMQRATIDATWEVERYKSTNGTTLEIDHNFDRVFENANGGLIVTNDPSYQPGLDSSVNGVSWTQLSRAPR